MFKAAAILAGLLAAQELDVKLDRVAAQLRFAEGPLWSPDGYLLYADTVANRIFRLAPNEKAQIYREAPGGAQGLAFDRDGRLYICEFRARRVVRINKKNEAEVLAERWEGKRLNAPNDIVVRRDGHVYFTDPAFGSQSDRRELDFHGIYHIPPKGELEVVAKWTTRPNGIALSANGRTLFVTNSDEATVVAFDLDRRGAASNPRTVISGIRGVPGGIRVDEAGNFYIAANDVEIRAPDGKLANIIRLGETPSNLAFGEGDWGALYITAQTSVFRVRLDSMKGSVQYSPPQ